jgi:hypothetical protein
MHNKYLKNRINLFMAGLCLFSILAGVKPVNADAAPPPTVPGSDLAAGQSTKVRMAEELVVFDITKLDHGIDYSFPVTAIFTMINDGPSDENMMVRFPMGCEIYDFSKLSDFEVNTDGVDLPVDYIVGEPVFLPMSPGSILEPRFCQTVKYAEFPVLFKSHEKTILNVSYTLQARPTGARASFGYYLETGRGWNSVIGKGTIKVIYPFPTTSENIKVSWEATNHFWPEYKGNEAVWTFTNLEPTSKNNLIFETIFPDYWKHVVDAEKVVTESPNNPESYVQLGDAFSITAADFHGSVNPYFVEMSITAYNKALYYDRFLPEAHTGIASMLWRQQWLKLLGDDKKGEFLKPIFKHLSIALAVDPDYPPAIELWDEINYQRDFILPTVNPSLLPSPSPTQTITPEP